MKKTLIFLLFLTAFAFCSDSDTSSGDTETINNTKPVPLFSKAPKPKVQPIINIENRNISIVIPNVKNMEITIFRPNGRKIMNKKIAGEKAEFMLPRAAKKEIIVTIDADRNYYSRKISLE